jgi:hypothetical protein
MVCASSITSIVSAAAIAANTGGVDAAGARTVKGGRAAARPRLAAKCPATYAALTPARRIFGLEPAPAENAWVELLLHEPEAFREGGELVHRNIDIDVGHFGLLCGRPRRGFDRNAQAV